MIQERKCEEVTETVGSYMFPAIPDLESINRTTGFHTEHHIMKSDSKCISKHSYFQSKAIP